ISGSTASVAVIYQGQVSSTVSLGVVPAAPGVFTFNSSGTGLAAAVNQNGSVNDASHPAAAGSVVTLFATGAGQTNPAGQDGLPGGTPLPLPVLPVTVTVGGQTATVQYAGASANAVAGIMQVNVQIPSGLTAGLAPVVVKVGSAVSQDGVTVSVAGN
ncbi:MAG TPA: hypothetical protein VGH38_15350, partial [Bryobacteraceae bacterium]